MKKLTTIFIIMFLLPLISCEDGLKIPVPTTPNPIENIEATYNEKTEKFPKIIELSFISTKYVIAELYIKHNTKGNPLLSRQGQNDSAIAGGIMVEMVYKNIMEKPIKIINCDIISISYFNEDIFDKDTLNYLNNRGTNSKVSAKVNVDITPNEPVRIASSNSILRYDTKRKPSKANHITYKLQNNIKKYLLYELNEELFPKNSVYKDLDVYKKVREVSKALKNIKSITYQITFEYEDGTSYVYTEVQDYKEVDVILNFVEIFDLSVNKNNTNKYGESAGEYTIFRNQFVSDISSRPITLGRGK